MLRIRAAPDTSQRAALPRSPRPEGSDRALSPEPEQLNIVADESRAHWWRAISSMLGDEAMCDVAFLVQGERLHALRRHCAVHSEVFGASRCRVPVPNAQTASCSSRRALLTPRLSPESHSIAAARALKSGLLVTAGGK